MFAALEQTAYDTKLGQVRLKATWFQVLVHVASLAPLAHLVWAFYTNNLTINPIQEATFRTGKYALVMLILSLAATPINTVFRWRLPLTVRKQFGLYAFFYASLHFTIFLALDYGLRWDLILEAVFEKAYALVGFAAFLILLPLAITSTKSWQKRLKKNWKWLHRLVYGAGILVAIHYIWVVKAEYTQPAIYTSIIVLLLALRIPSVKQFVDGTRKRLAAARKPAGADQAGA